MVHLVSINKHGHQEFELILIYYITISKKIYKSIMKMNERKQTQTQRFGVLPNREAMKMCPEFIFKTRKIGLCYVQVLKSVKDFIVHFYLLPLLSAESTLNLTLTLSPCKIQDSATALCIFHDHTKFNQNEQFFGALKRYYAV